LEREFAAIARALGEDDGAAFYVDDWGTDAAAIRAAVAAAAEAGGGTIHFKPGATYTLEDGDTHPVVVPLAGANHDDGNVNFFYHVLLDELEGITFDFHGAELVSPITFGNSGMFVLDGCRNITFRNGRIRGAHEHNALNEVTTNAGVQAVCATSQGRDSYGLRLECLDVRECWSSLYCFGTKDPTYRVRGVTMDRVRFETGMYGLTLHENGDNVTARYELSDMGRDFFVFGVRQFDLDVFTEPGPPGNEHGLQGLIKAYRNDTADGRVRHRTTKTTISTSHIVLASDYDTDTQAVPSRIRNIELNVDNSQGDSSIGSPVNFMVLEDGAFVTAATQVFDGILIRGIAKGIPDFSSTPVQDVDGSLDTDGLIVETGDINDVYAGTGFVNPS
jgi:hypothetical protein